MEELNTEQIKDRQKHLRSLQVTIQHGSIIHIIFLFVCLLFYFMGVIFLTCELHNVEKFV